MVISDNYSSARIPQKLRAEIELAMKLMQPE